MLSTADMADSAALSDHAGGCEARILFLKETTMSESIEDQVSRLRAMSICSPVSGTDLDEEGIAAIALAVRVLSVLEHCGTRELWIESWVLDDGRTCLKMETEAVVHGTLLECFSEAGRVLV